MSDTATRRRALWGAFAGILVYGYCLPLVGTHLPRLQEELGLSIAESGWVAGAPGAGFVLATLGGGWLADAVGLTRIVGVGLLLMGSGLGLLASAHGFAGALLGAGVFGVGAGFAEAAGTAVVSEAAGGKKRRSLLNLSQVLFGIGAFCSPAIAGAMARQMANGWRWSVWVPVPLAAGLAVFMVAQPVLRGEGDETIHWRGVVQLVKRPVFVLLALAMFLYVGGEQGICQWLPTFAQKTRGFSEQTGQWAMAAFWGAMAAGRLGVALTGVSISDLTVIKVGGLGSAVVAALLALLPSQATFVLLAAAVGLLNAGLWPTIMAAAGTRFRQFPGTALGLIAGMGALGWLVLLPAMGYVARLAGRGNGNQGLAYGMLLPIGCFALIAVCAWLTVLCERPKPGA